jgi:Tfp pilus assembly protein PilV
MVAVVLISIACLALIGTQIFALRAGETNRQQHTASVIAGSLLAERDRDSRNSQETFDELLHLPKAPVPDMPGYLYKMDETKLGTNLKEIRVEVFYRQRHENREIDQSYPLKTVVYYGG